MTNNTLHKCQVSQLKYSLLCGENMAVLLPLAATLCFPTFNETVHSAFAHNHYVQIIHNVSSTHTCEDDFLKQIESRIPVYLMLQDVKVMENIRNFIIFYSDTTNEDLHLVIFRDLETLPCYSNVLIVHSNITLQQISIRIIKEAFRRLVLYVTILCTINSTEIIVSKNKMNIWLPTMRKQTLRVSLFQYSPFVYYNAKKGLHDGIEKNILDQIINGWNITYVEHVPNSWDLVQKDVAKGDDIGLCGSWSEAVNYTTVDATRYYTQACSTFVVPKSKLVPLSFIYILQSFHYSLYMLLLITMILLSILLTLLSKTHRQHADYVYYFLEVYKSTINMSITTLPKTNSLRFILGVWLLCAILINVFHTAGLTKRLSFPVYTKPVNTFADMHNQNIKWQLRSSSLLPLINASHDHNINKLRTLLVGSDTIGVDDNDIDYARFASPVNLVYHDVDVSIERFESLARNARPLTQCLSNSYFVFLIKKHSPIKQIFDNKLKQITQAGLVQAWMRQLQYKQYKELKLMPLFHQTYPDFTLLRALTLKHLQGAFIILAGGYVVGIIILIMERYF